MLEIMDAIGRKDVETGERKQWILACVLCMSCSLNWLYCATLRLALAEIHLWRFV